MSLHQIAQHLQDAGRNGDSMLVHMTPKEVSGLQALAKAHGGSLTTNPKTGLPEAFFLEAILPTLLGAGMQTAGFTAMQAALAAGAIGTAVTGDLGQGIMAGLGAYGGAGLAGGLAKAGTRTPIYEAPKLAAEVNPVLQGFRKAPNLFGGGNPQGITALPGFGGGLPSFEGVEALPGFGRNLPSFAPSPAAAVTPTVNAAPAAPSPAFSTVSATGTYQPQPQTAMDKLGAGVKRATSGAEGLKEVLAASEEIAPYSGLASLANLTMSGEKKKPSKSKSYIRPYKLNRDYEPSGYDDTGYGTSERRYFDDEYIALAPYEAPGPEYAADGGLMGVAKFADGGYTNNQPYQYGYGYVGGGMGQRPQYGPGSGSSEENSDVIADPYKYDFDFTTGKFVQKAGPGIAPQTELSTNPQSYNAAMLKPLYQQYFGRDVDPEGLKTYTARQFSPAELDTIFTSSPEYLARKQKLDAEKKEASYATATQAANAFEDILGRKIDPGALKFYTQQNRMTPAELQKTLMQSEEYLTNLTKPFVPAPRVDAETGLVAIQGALRTPQQEAERPRDMSSFYDKMERQLSKQTKRAGYAAGGPVEMMSAANAAGANMTFPQALYDSSAYSNPTIQRPMQTKVLSHGLDAPVDPYTGEEKFAGGGLSNLGSYSDGGRLLKGPGDGVSDSIPAVIGKRQPARLADGEFVVPARIVSELGNGSTEAGARKLYAMMDRIQKARKKSVGKNKVATNTRADKYLPA